MSTSRSRWVPVGPSPRSSSAWAAPATPGPRPKGRVFPLTIDELAEAEALLLAIDRRLLDRTPIPRAPLDILAQQIVSACVPEPWSEPELFDRVRRAWPYRDLQREDFDAVVALHTQGRYALRHRDGVGGGCVPRNEPASRR